MKLNSRGGGYLSFPDAPYKGTGGYDYQILSAILLKVSPAGMKLAEAVYSSWEDDNQYGVKSGEWVFVDDAWMTYEGESGAGMYRITNQ